MQMIEKLKNWNPALRVRRNHALEHATLQILAEKHHPHRLGGLSDTQGFWVFGEVDPESLFNAAEEARKRAEEAAKPKFIAEHKVSPDETLSHLALKYYGHATPEYYMLIYEANKETIGGNPNIVRIGTVLNIPELPEELKK